MSAGGKAYFRESENISKFIDLHGYGQGHVFFMTVTFKQNDYKKPFGYLKPFKKSVEDKVRVEALKKDCAEGWNLLRSYMNKKSVRKRFGIPQDAQFRFIDVWEQHKKGGWHLHLLGYIEGVSTKRLRKLFRHFRSVTESKVGYVHIEWTRGHDANGIKYYMSKYLGKNQKRIKRVRYVNYSRNWERRVKGAIAFVHGMGAIWRLACRELDLNFPRTFKFFYNNSSSNKASFRKLCLVIEAWQNSQFLTACSFLKDSLASCFLRDAFWEDLKEFSDYFSIYKYPRTKPPENKFQPELSLA